jgi:Ca-activated chloride channel family protein
VQNLKVTVNGTALELTPNLLPDLYVGQPLVLLGRTDKLAGSLTISGTLGKRQWSSTVNFADAIESPAIAKLWARRKIDDIETDRTRGKIEGEAADKAIAEVGLEHSLVTSQTSLVAVDETPSRPAGETLTREELPINLPAGWNFDSLFGGDAAKAALTNAAHPGGTENVDDPAEAMELPQTATDFQQLMINGGMLLAMVASGLLLLRRRRGQS